MAKLREVHAGTGGHALCQVLIDPTRTLPVDVAIMFDINCVYVSALPDQGGGGAAVGPAGGLVLRSWPWAVIEDWEMQDAVPCISSSRVAVLVTVSFVGSFVFSVLKEQAALMQEFERQVAAMVKTEHRSRTERWESGTHLQSGAGIETSSLSRASPGKFFI